MKTKFKQIAAVALFSFIFLTGNVNAKGTEIASSLETIKEPAMEIENWMVNDNYWDNKDVVFYIDEVSEESLELESWMIDENSWNNRNLLVVENEIDTDLNLENWMVNQCVWN